MVNKVHTIVTKRIKLKSVLPLIYNNACNKPDQVWCKQAVQQLKLIIFFLKTTLLNANKRLRETRIENGNFQK